MAEKKLQPEDTKSKDRRRSTVTSVHVGITDQRVSSTRSRIAVAVAFSANLAT